MRNWAKSKLYGIDVSAGPAGIPLPERVTTSGEEPAAVAAMLPFRTPVAVGEKIKLTLQLVPGCIVAGQLLVCEKSPVVVSVRAAGDCPGLPRVVVIVGLAVLISCAPKS